MRVLFVNAPLWNETKSITGEAMGGLAYFPPLGMLYLSSYLKKHASIPVETRLFDYTFETPGNYEALDAVLDDFEPEVIGLTTYTFILYDIFEICKRIKAKRPDCKVVLGGKHVEIYPRETAVQPFVDYVIAGEGEIAFTELIEGIAAGSSEHNISGLYYQADTGFIDGGKAERIRNIDELPFPDLTLLEKQDYRYIFNSGKPEGIMSTSRGCPYTCKYCMSAYSDRVFAGRSAENVVDEMQMWVNHGFENINFFDDTFNANIKRAKRICRLIIDRGLKVKFSFRGTPNCVDEELAQLLAQAGCERAILGVESASQEILVKFGRRSEQEQIEKAYGLLDRQGITTAGFFMIGFLGESKEMAQDTIRLACDLPLDYAQFTVLFPAPGTPYYDLLRNEHDFDDIWKDFSKNPPKEFSLPYFADLIPEPEIRQLARSAYRRFYFRPNLIWRHLKKLGSFAAFKVKLVMALKLFSYSLKKRVLEKKDFVAKDPIRAR